MEKFLGSRQQLDRIQHVRNKYAGTLGLFFYVYLTLAFSVVDLKGWYQNTIASNRLRILIYNGDADPAVQESGVEEWARNLGVPLVEDWFWTV